MPEQKLTWGQIPEKLREWLDSLQYSDDNTEEEEQDVKLSLANEIMEAIKPELEKAFDSNGQFGNTPDFETWYQNTYLK